MVLSGEGYVIVSESANCAYWSDGHYPEEWTPISVFKRYAPEPKGSGVEPHYHDGDEFWLFSEGEGEVWLDGKSYSITPNTAVYTPRGVVHRFQLFVESQINALVTRLDKGLRPFHLVAEMDGEPCATADPIVVSGRDNIGPFPERGLRCPLSELRTVPVAAGENITDLSGVADTNEHLLVLSGDVELSMDSQKVVLGRGDVVLLRAGVSRRVVSVSGACLALARE